VKQENKLKLVNMVKMVKMVKIEGVGLGGREGGREGERERIRS